MVVVEPSARPRDVVPVSVTTKVCPVNTVPEMVPEALVVPSGNAQLTLTPGKVEYVTTYELIAPVRLEPVTAAWPKATPAHPLL